METNPQKFSTSEVAERLRVRAETIRRALCVQGHYMGARPVKLSNGRLLWSAADVERIVNGEPGAT